MANRLKMARVQSILLLHSQGWSRRRIARELSIDRETVSRYVQLDQQLAAKCEVEPDGVSKPANAPIPGPGSSALANLSPVPIEPAGPASGYPGRRSDCEPWREVIVAKRDQGLSARRIYQDLAREHAAQVSYDSVRRFMRRLGWARPLPFRRIECAPGQEAQVDFGTGAPVIGADGKRRRTHVFRIVLSHSRKAYSEATYRQTTEDFLGALENAFLHFGGVPQTLIIDNLKAAVKNPDWFDPELLPKVAAFCRH
jgi:transposase